MSALTAEGGQERERARLHRSSTSPSDGKMRRARSSDTHSFQRSAAAEGRDGSECGNGGDGGREGGGSNEEGENSGVSATPATQPPVKRKKKEETVSRLSFSDELGDEGGGGEFGSISQSTNLRCVCARSAMRAVRPAVCLPLFFPLQPTPNCFTAWRKLSTVIRRA
jgi:hypothetical protein